MHFLGALLFCCGKQQAWLLELMADKPSRLGIAPVVMAGPAGASAAGHKVERMCVERCRSLSIVIGLLVGLWAGLAQAQCVALVPASGGASFWDLVRQGAERAGAELGVEVYYRGTPRSEDANAQLKIIELSLKHGCQAMVIAPVGPAITGYAAQLRAQRGLPSVYIDRDVGGDPDGWLIATDNRRAGEQAGRWLADYLGGQGEVLLVRLSPDIASTTAREEGFLSAARAGGLSVDGSQVLGDDAQRIHTYLLDKPQRFKALFSVNASTTSASYAALRHLNAQPPLVHVGFDSSVQLASALAAGEIQALLLQQAQTMGYDAVHLVWQLAQGKTPSGPKVRGLDASIATADNLDNADIRALLSYQPRPAPGNAAATSTAGGTP